jgi:hypothetical protein
MALESDRRWSWRDFRDTVGLVAVIAGLVFVGLEIRQNTAATRGATLQAIAEQGQATFDIALENREVRVAYQRTRPGLRYATPEDLVVLGWWYGSVLRIAENRYRQVQLGILPEDALTQLGGASLAYRHPYFGVFWESQRPTVPSDFATWVEANLLPFVEDSLPRAANPLPEVAAHWAAVDSAG